MTARLSIVTVTASLTTLLSITVLIGWYGSIPSLIQLNSGFEPMQHNTALGFLFSGLALIFLNSRQYIYIYMCVFLLHYSCWLALLRWANTFLILICKSINCSWITMWQSTHHFPVEWHWIPLCVLLVHLPRFYAQAKQSSPNIKVPLLRLWAVWFYLRAYSRLLAT